MKKQINLIFLGILLSILLIGVTSAYNPETHVYIGKKICEQAPNSPVCQLAQKYPNEWIACSFVGNDFSVFTYWNEGFNTISKTYVGSHATNYCTRLLSSASNEAERTCAYSICIVHENPDSISHNEFIVAMIDRTSMPNSIIHALSEEAVNDNIIDKEGKQIILETRQALTIVAPQMKEFIRKAVTTENSNFNFDTSYDEFVRQVLGSSGKFTAGFKGFTAVPIEIYAIVLLYFLVGLFGMALLIRKKDKGKLNKISMYLIVFLCFIPVILLFVLFFTGKLWMFYEYASAPLTSILPTHGWENYVNKAIERGVSFANNPSAGYISTIQDPSGFQNLKDANSRTSGVRTVIGIILFLVLALLVYLNIRKKKQ